jgi:hypothetical protein
MWWFIYNKTCRWSCAKKRWSNRETKIEELLEDYNLNYLPECAIYVKWKSVNGKSKEIELERIAIPANIVYKDKHWEMTNNNENALAL